MITCLFQKHMCGIAGILSANSKEVTQQRLQKLTDALIHRGPEEEGFYINSAGTVAFGHRRLSIIDLTNAGAQPMHYLGRFTITYNGELYNYVELKEVLVKKGYSFTTKSDTEVILAAYACYGKECLNYFDGMFSFALWDEEEQNLFCARDRFGEKPFYYNYSSSDNCLVFASEMKALWAAGVNKKIDNSMLLNYLILGWVQNPVSKEQTFFENITSLPPAHYLIYKTSQHSVPYLEVKSYWDLDKETQIKDYTDEAIKTTFLELFTKAVSLRLRSDVAIGSSLSGGIDSSSIVATVHSLIDNSNHQKTFSAVFPGFEQDESKHIESVVKNFALENYRVTPTANDFIKDFDTLVYHQEEPFQSGSIYAQYKVYELAKQKGVTVILDGQGADETLAGYTKYYHWHYQEMLAGYHWKAFKKEITLAKQNGLKITWGLKNYAAAFFPQQAANYLQKTTLRQQLTHGSITKEFLLSSLNKTSIYKPAISGLNDILYFNTMQFGLEELLRYADRNSMAHSLEVRLPFLSHDLVQFVFSLPSSHKISQGFTKFLLRRSMSGSLPDSIVWRKDKVGFEPPQKQWMEDKKVEEYIHESKRILVKLGVLKKVSLEAPIIGHEAYKENNFDWRYLCAAQCL